MRTGDRTVIAILSVIAVAALTVPTWIVTHAPTVQPATDIAKLPKRIVPRAELPAVEPLRLVDLSLDEARAYNASVPLSMEPNPPARPFRFAGNADDLAKATDCLAAAVIYEAGDDAAGERAVAQVVLNRLRHPAFPKTVCAVVFEGSDRSTGCQFTFTCDGALTRWQPSDAGWRRAHEIAAMALSGSVYRPIGYSTHYHTDWVVPYWQSSLDKVAVVHAHLFFRWTGWWGTPPAFNRRPVTGEPAIAKLAAISDAHRLAGALDEASAALATAAIVMGDPPAALAGDPNSFLVTMPADTAPQTLPALAAKACGDRPLCKYSAWADAAMTPKALPLDPQQIATMTFSYLRDRTAGYEKSLWNCQQIKRPDRSQCMKAQVFVTWKPAPIDAASTAMTSAAPSTTVAVGPSGLSGVRRRPSPTPTPSPSAMPPVRPPETSPAARP